MSKRGDRWLNYPDKKNRTILYSEKPDEHITIKLYTILYSTPDHNDSMLGGMILSYHYLGLLGLGWVIFRASPRLDTSNFYLISLDTPLLIIFV